MSTLRRTAVSVGQTLLQTFDLRQAVASPEQITAAQVSIDPDDGGCIAKIDYFSAQQVVASFEGVGAGPYDAQMIVDTDDARAMRICLPLVVLAAPAVAPLEFDLRPGEAEKYSLFYGLRMKSGETLQGVVAQVPTGLTASFALDPEHTQKIAGEIAVDDNAASGVYDIQLQVTTNLSLPYNDILRVYVEGCYG